MINIMLVDDHVLFRESLRVLIEKDKFIKVSCEAATMSECIIQREYLGLQQHAKHKDHIFLCV